MTRERSAALSALEANLTPAELVVLRRVLAWFPRTSIGTFEPYVEAPPP
jgi:hypothetical protein